MFTKPNMWTQVQFVAKRQKYNRTIQILTPIEDNLLHGQNLQHGEK